jgi:AP-3 complex subunit mu
MFENLSISVVLPFVSSLSGHPNVGTIEFNSTSKVLTWVIGPLKDVLKSLFASFTLHETRSCDNLLDFKVNFRINMHSLSGLQISSLVVQRESYLPFKGGRSFVESRRCNIRYEV